ncbi:uncharacterized protein METZ01_LOCUS328297, partial [marine metagenome]
MGTNMIYEERRTLTHTKSAEDYLDYCKSDLWPRLRAEGGQPICLLSGLIGDPANQYLQVTGFEDVQAWDAVQSTIWPSPTSLVESES